MLTRDELITHILKIMNLDIEYARAALRHYNDLLPHFNLNAGVRDALKGQQ